MTDQSTTRSFADPPFFRSRGLGVEDFEKADPYLQQALVENKRGGLQMAVRARWVALAITAVYAFVFNPFNEALFYFLMILAFAFIGYLQLRVAKVTRSRLEFLLILCDLGLLAFIMILPNPFSHDTWPAAFQFHLTDFNYFFVLLALGTLAYSWRTIVAFGVFTTLFWGAAVIWAVYFGDKIPELTEKSAIAFSGYERITDIFDPNNVLIADRIQEIVIFLIVAGILLLNGKRSNDITLRQAGIARERANLSRHFPPTIVDQMADQDHPFDQVRSQDVAAVFVDIVGFTRLAEQKSPIEVITLLREFHSRLEAVVFNHQGTLDKFMGDGLMATFGTPEPGPDDAYNAVDCTLAMLKEIDNWNDERARSGQDPIKVSIGAHFGSVILGDIGSARRLEYAVLGDTVNVASRLEALTRPLDVRLVVSDELIETLKEKSSPEQSNNVLEKLRFIGPQSIRGRNQEISVWSNG